MILSPRLAGALQAAVQELWAAVWAWVALGMLFFSPVIGNLYRIGDDTFLNRRVYLISVMALLFLYSMMSVLRDDRRKAHGTLLLFAAAALYLVDISTGPINEWTVGLQLAIFSAKVATVFVVASIFLSFPKIQVFERCMWACLVGLEGYSALQYPTCAIARRFYDDGVSKTACGRVVGDILAYIELPILYGLAFWVVARWVWLGFQARHAGRSAEQDPD